MVNRLCARSFFGRDLARFGASPDFDLLFKHTWYNFVQLAKVSSFLQALTATHVFRRHGKVAKAHLQKLSSKT